VVTHNILAAPKFTFPEGMEDKVDLVCSGDSNPGPHAHISEHTSERTDRASQTEEYMVAVKRIIQELYKNYTRIIQESYKNHTRIIQELYKNFTRIIAPRSILCYINHPLAWPAYVFINIYHYLLCLNGEYKRLFTKLQLAQPMVKAVQFQMFLDGDNIIGE